MTAHPDERNSCACWCIAAPIVDRGFDVHRDGPDHVCPDLMRLTVREWTLDRWAELSGDFTGLINSQSEYRRVPTDTSIEEFLALSPAPRHDPGAPEAVRIADEIRTGLHRLGEIDPAPWPMFWGGRVVGLVVQQWVQGEPDRTLANKLAEHEGWQYLVGFAQEFYGRFQAAGGTDFDSWEGDPPLPLPWPGSRRDRLGFSAFFGMQLRGAGLPDTPATLRYLRARAQGRNDALPARGVLVTTLVGVRRGNETFTSEEDALRYPPDSRFADSRTFDSRLIDPNPEITLSGALPWIPGPLLTRAQKVVLQHQRWVARLAQHPMTTVFATRRAQSTAYLPTVRSEQHFDYLSEALLTAPHWVATARVSSENREAQISAYLNTVADRVGRRRKRAGVTDPPPSDWRDEARRRLRPLLHQVP